MKTATTTTSRTLMKYCLFNVGIGVLVFLPHVHEVVCLSPASATTTTAAIQSSRFYDVHDVPSPTTRITSSSSIIVDRGISSWLLSSSSSLSPSMDRKRQTMKMTDKVERILDANTVQFQKIGTVKLLGVRMPSPTRSTGFEFPPCFSYQPSYKLRQLIPKGTSVDLIFESNTARNIKSSSSSSTIPSVVIIRQDNGLNINQELVRTGFSKVISGKRKTSRHSSDATPSADTVVPSIDDGSNSLLDYDLLLQLEEQAKSQGFGIFQRCDATDNNVDDATATRSGNEKDKSLSKGTVSTTTQPGSGWSTAPFQAEFEPLQRTMETVWGDDGGKRQLRISSSGENEKDGNGGRTMIRPKNPGDTRSCADFNTYEDALEWYERYEPYYGDVAKLDRDNDGVPCPGLPHTANQNKYRMKVPSLQKGGGR
mmetsp:Transcript_7666/g.18932  ORF Transcript_7666/g.18932 Transcript_7666/m.18932 type:complete len:425 (-) Transcript_7666:4091-5365(-)